VGVERPVFWLLGADSGLKQAAERLMLQEQQLIAAAASTGFGG
jgi:hypothetical protein